MTTQDLVSAYVTIGAGGVCVVAVIWLMIYFVRTIKPKLDQLEKSNEVTNEILRSTNDMISKTMDVVAQNQSVIESSSKAIENNTEALKNFSKVLQEFCTLMNANNNVISDIEGYSKEMTKDIIKIKERLRKE